MNRTLLMAICAAAVLGSAVLFLLYKSPSASVTNAVDYVAPAATLANPASVFCTQHGGTSLSTTSPEGGQQNVCTFSSGAACDESALFRGECDVEGVSTSGAFTDGSTTVRMVYRTDGSFLSAPPLGFDHLDMHTATSGSGARYLSSDGTVEFWEHQGTATIRKNDTLLFTGDIIEQTEPEGAD